MIHRRCADTLGMTRKAVDPSSGSAFKAIRDDAEAIQDVAGNFEQITITQ